MICMCNLRQPHPAFAWCEDFTLPFMIHIRFHKSYIHNCKEFLDQKNKFQLGLQLTYTYIYVCDFWEESGGKENVIF